MLVMRQSLLVKLLLFFQEVCAKYDSPDLLCNLPFVCSGKQHSRSIIYGDRLKESRIEIKNKSNSRNKRLNIIFYIIFLYSFSSRSQEFLLVYTYFFYTSAWFRKNTYAVFKSFGSLITNALGAQLHLNVIQCDL